MSIKSYTENGMKLYIVRVKMRDQYGKQLVKTKSGIPSERKAAEIEFQFKKELESLTTGKPSTLWKGWFDHCIERMTMELMPSTVINYRGKLDKWVTPVWGNKCLKDFTRSDVHRLIFDELPPDMNPYSRRNLLKMVNRIFQMAVEEGYLDRNPCLGLSVRVPEADQKVLTSSEVEKFLTEAKLVGHAFYPVWVMALMTGMRSGELYALQWDDVDFETKLIRVTKQWTSKNGITPTKTRKCRIVPISKVLLEFLKEHKLQSKAWYPFVLPRLSKWERGEQALVTREFCAVAGVTSLKFHDLRATFITNLLSRGVSLARVMSIVGHTELKTTNGYLRKSGVEVLGATDDLSYDLPTADIGQVLHMSNVWRK